MKKNKLLSSILILFVVFGLGLSISAVWDVLSKRDDNNNVTLSDNVELVVSETVGNTGNLVPESAVLKEGDVTSVTYTYVVSLDKTKQLQNALNATVAVENVKIDGSDTYSDLVNVVISNESFTLAEDEVTVTVTISLNEPENMDQVNAIMNKTISFDVLFNANK